MDSTTDYPESDRPLVALPGVCARVRLPMPPNFLTASTGGQVAIGDLHPEDVPLLAFAMARQLRNHWHTRMAKGQRLSETEAPMIGAELIPDGVCYAIAHRRDPGQWHEIGRDAQERRADDVREVLQLFLEEFTRG